MPSPANLLAIKLPDFKSVRFVGELIEVIGGPKQAKSQWMLLVIALKDTKDVKESADLAKLLDGLSKQYNAQASTKEAPTPATIFIQRHWVDDEAAFKQVKLPKQFTQVWPQ